MRLATACCFGLLLVARLVRADTLPGKIVEESWDAAYLQGDKIGFFHTTVRAIEHNGEKVLRTSGELDLTVRRFNQQTRLRAQTGTEETPDGKVTGVFMTYYLDKGQKLEMKGRVVDKQVLLSMNDGRQERKNPWDDRVIGMYRQQRLFAEKNVKPGDRFSYVSFESSIQMVVTVNVTVKDEEEVATPAGKKRLLRVEAASDEIQAQNGAFKLPGVTMWLDKDFQVARTEMELPIGKIVLHRTNKNVAMRPGGTSSVDIGTAADVRLNHKIPNPHGVNAVVYKITVKGDDEPAKTFAQDERQQIKNLKGNTFDLHVRAVRQPPAQAGQAKVEPEYLESSFFITSDDPDVRQLANQAIGKETDPWEKACRIEKWVFRHMNRFNPSVEFTTAARVAKGLEGDCRHHAVLTTAMCRAAGVPSRTALGLIYVDKPAGPVMGFHMWTEVWVRGQWIGIDATLGRGGIGAAHLKVSDHSWHNTQSLTPVLPVIRVVGKLSIAVEGGN